MSRRGARSLDLIQIPPWKAVSFTDLHVSAKTLERTLRVLARVREEAIARAAFVVFNGDFWDSRGVLAVRQLDALLDEFKLWHEAGIEAVLIPGNHDQVSMSGLIHGLRVFEAFPRFTVATERVLWPERKIAFIPWREDPEEQAAQFELPGNDWTIFCHAEVEGATTNYAHKAPGRVMVGDLEKVARAVYCGHYHKRQQIGDRVWYLGSPFQMTFGEMADPPKGIAFVSAAQLEPEWIPLEGFPRHHRVFYGEEYDLASIEAHDVVELYAPAALLGTEEVDVLRSKIAAADVRPLPVKEDERASEVTFALSLDEAIDEYVQKLAEEAAEAGTDLVAGDVDADDLKGLARVILSELPEAATVNPLAPVVEIVSVSITDFCAIRGTLSLTLEELGLAILTGRVGTGKTAFVDAINWCFYGVTNPRKAGSNGSTLRGDEIINDLAKLTRVEVGVRLWDGPERSDLTVIREKARGKGATASVEGLEAPDGIQDTQVLIDRVVGLPHALWRTCVSLGQGAVGNFITDADKARKALLSDAFGLSVCPDAQKLIKARLKPLRTKLEHAANEVAGLRARIEATGEADYAVQIKEWEDIRAAAKKGAQTAGEQAAAAIVQCDEQLAGEAGWMESKRKHEETRDALVQQLTSITMHDSRAKMEREVGALEAERSVVEGQAAKARVAYEQMVKSASSGGMPCPTCGQPMQATDVHVLISEKEQEIAGHERQIGTFKTKLSNLNAQMASQGHSVQHRREGLEAHLNEYRANLEKIAKVLSQFTAIRHNKTRAEQQLAAARQTYQEQDLAKNPWIARQAEIEAKIAGYNDRLIEIQMEQQRLEEQVGALAFWEHGFGPKGLPVLVLRTVLYELETYANRFLATVLAGTVYVQLTMTEEDLGVRYFQQCDDGEVRERRYEQLSGGQRRCVELAFAPWAISEMVFARCGVRIPFLVVDELTTHLGAEEKPLVCEALRLLNRGTVLVIDHDAVVQGEFDVAFKLEQGADGTALRRVMR